MGRRKLSAELQAELEETAERLALLSLERAESMLIAMLTDILNDLLPPEKKTYRQSRYLWTTPSPHSLDLLTAKLSGDYAYIESRPQLLADQHDDR